jgi:hypothetical protein
MVNIDDLLVSPPSYTTPALFAASVVRPPGDGHRLPARATILDELTWMLDPDANVRGP